MCGVFACRHNVRSVTPVLPNRLARKAMWHFWPLMTRCLRTFGTQRGTPDSTVALEGNLRLWVLRPLGPLPLHIDSYLLPQYPLPVTP
ncbi:hypothetical protein FQZ97_592840 [compost metagenome]